MSDDNGGVPGGIRTVKASEFKARCLALMDEVASGGGDIVITKRGKPVARLAQYRERKYLRHGADRGRIQILGDIVSPLYPNFPDDLEPYEESVTDEKAQ